ncbi:hypothetical protein [Streptomyces sp. IB2014 016-6]|uniref:hypothetical protein n=1 Tax=Streptomyces sp. IB2014 016-6 TaxID=2517818 RepID=UPI0011CC2F41|nr:hypothetical protein [Streptomyces sp. IB2014 016-6]TXL88079.1 hypothetical protein EW053_19670 [Streptomyces sp. IB2014 016-6]
MSQSLRDQVATLAKSEWRGFTDEETDTTEAPTARAPARRPETQVLARLREDWKTSAREFLTDRVGLIDSLLERARAAAAAIPPRVASVVDIVLAVVDVTAMMLVMYTTAAGSTVGACSPKHTDTSPSSCGPPPPRTA